MSGAPRPSDDAEALGEALVEHCPAIASTEQNSADARAAPDASRVEREMASARSQSNMRSMAVPFSEATRAQPPDFRAYARKFQFCLGKRGNGAGRGRGLPYDRGHPEHSETIRKYHFVQDPDNSRDWA